MPPEHTVLTANWSSGSKLCTTLVREGISPNSKSPVLYSGLTIEPGGALTVDNLFNYHDAGAAAIVLQSNAPDDAAGSLIHWNDGVEATIERYIGQWTGESPLYRWHMISSPVRGMDIRPEFVPWGQIPSWIDFYRWDEALVQNNAGGTPVTGWWVNSKQPGGQWNPLFEEQFVSGKGYLVAYARPGKDYGNKSHAFTGTMETHAIPVSNLTHSPEGKYAGWHLLGNPYASAIDWTKGEWEKQNILGGPKIWDARYASYTPVISIIPAMNAFMVHTSGNGALRIPPEARVHDPAGWYKQYAHARCPDINGTADLYVPSSDPPHIRLLATDTESHTAQTTIILFRDDASGHYDPLIDTPFMSGHAPAFYSLPPASTESDPYGQSFPKLALNNVPEPRNGLVIPLGFEKNDAASFRIELLHTVCNTSLFLEDRTGKQMHCLQPDAPYMFTARDDDPPLRFLLHLTDGTAPVPSWDNSPDSDISIFARPGAIIVHSPCERCSLYLFDTRGSARLQAQLSGTEQHTIPHSLSPGVYVARVQCRDAAYAAKVLVPPAYGRK